MTIDTGTYSPDADLNNAQELANQALQNVKVTEYGIELVEQDVSQKYTVDQLKGLTTLHSTDQNADIELQFDDKTHTVLNPPSQEAWVINAIGDSSQSNLVDYFQVHAGEIAEKILTPEEQESIFHGRKQFNPNAGYAPAEKQEILTTLLTRFDKVVQLLNQRGLYIEVGASRNSLPQIAAALQGSILDLGKKVSIAATYESEKINHTATESNRREVYSFIRTTPDGVEMTGPYMKATEPTFHFEKNGKEFEMSLVDISNFARQTLADPSETNKAHMSMILDLLSENFPQVDLKRFKTQILEKTAPLSQTEQDQILEGVFSFPLPGSAETDVREKNLLAQVVDADREEAGRGKIIAEINPTVQVDLAIAQAIMNSYIPVSYRIDTMNLENGGKISGYNWSRQLAYRAVLKAHNVLPANDSVLNLSLTNDQDQAYVDQLVDKITTTKFEPVTFTSYDGSVKTLTRDAMNIVDVNRQAMIDELKSVGVTDPRLESVWTRIDSSLNSTRRNENEPMTLRDQILAEYQKQKNDYAQAIERYARNPDSLSLPSKPQDIRKITRQFVTRDIVSAFKNLSISSADGPEKVAQARNMDGLITSIVSKHVATDFKLNPNRDGGSRFEKLSGFKTAAMNIQAVESMGLKGIELLYRRAQTESEHIAEKPGTASQVFDEQIILRTIDQSTQHIDGTLAEVTAHIADTKDFIPATLESALNLMQEASAKFGADLLAGVNSAEAETSYRAAQAEVFKQWQSENPLLVSDAISQTIEYKKAHRPDAIHPTQYESQLEHLKTSLDYLNAHLAEETSARSINRPYLFALLRTLHRDIQAIPEAERGNFQALQGAFDSLSEVAQKALDGRIYTQQDLIGKSRQELISLGLIDENDEEYSGLSDIPTVSSAEGIYLAPNNPRMNARLSEGIVFLGPPAEVAEDEEAPTPPANPNAWQRLMVHPRILALKSFFPSRT